MLQGLKRIISGAQAGVERAALDSAISGLVYSWGGCVPKGRLAEDGEIPEHYFNPDRHDCGLREHSQSRDHRARTIRNIADSDATLVLRLQGVGRVLPPGIKLTIKSLHNAQKKYRLFDPSKIHSVPRAVQWVCETKISEGDDKRPIRILNVTGPQESRFPGIYDHSKQFMNDVLSFVFMYQRWGVKIWAPKRLKAKTQ